MIFPMVDGVQPAPLTLIYVIPTEATAPVAEAETEAPIPLTASSVIPPVPRVLVTVEPALLATVCEMPAEPKFWPTNPVASTPVIEAEAWRPLRSRLLKQHRR